MNKKAMKKGFFRIKRKLGRFFDHSHVWLVSDRAYFAGDNGEAFFRYLQDKPVNSIFAIKKDSPDYERIKKIGRVVEYESRTYRKLLCIADCHISSQTLHMENHEETLQIFLQHGVSEKDISPMVNPCSHKNFVLITTGIKEYESFLTTSYSIKKENVWLTGFPRYDSLENRKEKVVTLSFTWRKHLAGKSEEEFVKSDYYKAYKDILHSKKIKQALELYGYKLMLKLHPEMDRFIKLFDLPEYIGTWDVPYSEIFAKSSLLITDYSSIVFDFAQLKKAVIYYQFDCDTFWDGELNYRRGYFDYERDGFGEVIKTFSELENCVEGYLKSECTLKLEYKDRMNNFFKYYDRNNCMRIYDRIWNKLKETYD